MNNILFDMDWTLYSFENWQYKWSKLEKEVQSNALKLLKILEWENHLKKFIEIKSKYWEEFSKAFEKIYKLKKNDYFNKVWDINPDWIINDNRNTLEVFNYFNNLNYNLYIVSESPLIWINRVLTYLKIETLITWIYSWQWDKRKSNWLLYEKIKADLWNNSYMIWDQINSDIVMAKNSWFNTIYISEKKEQSINADYNIIKLTDLYSIIR